MLKWLSKTRALVMASAVGLVTAATSALATPFTMTVPDTGVSLPPEYPEAGGIAIVLTGVNGNVYYQFSDPDGAFIGFQYRGSPTRFRGNPFTINDPISLDCGFRSCTDYFGGALARIDVRFSAYDGDTQVGGFDQNNITLVMNGYDVGNWSGRTTDITNNSGTTSFGTANGFGNNTFNTGWFSSTNSALLANILQTNQTTTQVRDRTPNDNYWDFTRGNSLSNPDLRTIAPGYELTKEARGGVSSYAAVGDIITFDYTVANIGSVPITDVDVFDDQIGSVTCSPTTLPESEPTDPSPPAPRTALCSADYRITQADIDAGSVTNIATASGTPAFGELGNPSETVTLTGPPKNNQISLDKSASPSTFTAVGQTITYTLTATNDGNTTLTDVAVTDPFFPALDCTAAELLPLSADNANNTLVCTATYVITQDDLDDAAINGAPLINTARVAARDPDNGLVENDDSATVTGPLPAPVVDVVKTNVTGDYDAEGDVISFTIDVTNNGNVTWPGPPTLTDTLDPGASCPAGEVAPGATITCTASYTIQPIDLDNGSITNTATAEITVGGVTASDDDSATANAIQNPAVVVSKSQATGPNPFDAEGQTLTYSYLIENTGNVTLSNVALSDNLVGVNCPATSIPAGGSITCSSDPYVTDLNDLNTGDVTNIATVNADDPNNVALTPVTDSFTVPADQQPVLTLVKSGTQNGTFTTGQTITYSYELTNDGNVTLPGPFTVDDNKFVNAISCPAGDLDPTDSVTCTDTYTITSDDVAAGFVSNTASASNGTTTSNTDSFSIAPSGEPSLNLTKTADVATYDSASDVITYTYVVTNDGQRDIDRSVNEITIADDKIASGDITCDPTPVVLPASSATTLTCTATYTPTQADLDAGDITNTATANVTIAGTPVASPDVSESVTNAIVPDFTLEKDAGSTTFAANGTVTYTFTITNLTEQTLSSVTITDPKLGGVVCTRTDVLTTATCTAAPYTPTQAEIDAGVIDNTATADATTPTGATLSRDGSESVTLDPTFATPAYTISKDATPTSFSTVGEVITYTVSVTNTGFVTLTDIVVDDPLIGLSCTLDPIAPGDTDATCTGTLTIDQNDIDTGDIVNLATVTGGGQTLDDDATVTAPTPNPVLTFDKSADGGYTVDGDVVRFTFTVTNDGNVTLNNVAMNDPFFAADPNCTFGTLLPGESASCAKNYTVDQGDVNDGSFTNTATASADPASGGPSLSVPDTEVVNGPAEAPALSVTKSADTGTTFDNTATPAEGDAVAAVTYSFSVTNTGNVTLTNLSLNDPRISFSCLLDDLEPGDVATTCSGGAPALSVVYNPDQDDIDFGAIVNEVTVTGETEQNTPVEADDTLTLTGPKQLPDLAIDKTSPDTTFAAVGDVLTYAYEVTNTGNITITSAISVDDDTTPVTCDPVPAGGVPPNGTLDCTATYTVTQDDLDNGFVTNVAAAEVDQPVVPSTPEYPDGVASIRSATDSVTINADQSPALSIIKRIQPGTPATFEAVGDVITYEFLVTNSGNVTTTAPINIDDPLLGAPFECTASLVAPDETITCVRTYAVDQDDLDAGVINNSADATTVFDSAPVVTPDPGTATATAVQQPSMTLDKSVNSIDTGTFENGAVVTYDFTVTNTGNQTIKAPIDIVDPLIGNFTCSNADLAPTDPPLVCQGTYNVSMQDVTFGSVTNTALATSPTVDSPQASETVPAGADATIEITKAADLTSFSALGDVITYTYTVTNTSPGSSGIRPAIAREIVIVDDRITGDILCYDPAADTVDGELDPDETVTCTGTGVYTITQDDLDRVAAGEPAGFVTNNAFGRVEPANASQDPILSPAVSVTVPGEANNLLSVTKTVVGGPATAVAGDLLNYQITVTNDGNQTLSNLALDDPLLPGATCDVSGADPLAPGATATCTGTYTVTQADIDTGGPNLRNTVDVTATTPQGTVVPGDAFYDQPIDPPLPSVDLVKALAEGEPDSAFSAVDQEIDYTITVTNNGNITLTSTRVTDILFPGEECLIGPLAPGDTDNTCVFTYTVTQDDLDRGFVDNEATAVSQPAVPGSPTVSDSDDITGQGPAREPEITVFKEALTTEFDDDSDTISYRFTIANTGNVTITAEPVITDSLIPTLTCDPFPTGGLAPTEFYQCMGIYSVLQDDVDAGEVVNVVDVTVANPVPGEPDLTATDTVTVEGTRTPAFTVTKSASASVNVTAGTTITYTYRVTNTGNVTLSPIELTDAHTTQAGTSNLTIEDGGVIASLAPSSFVELTAEYTVTQDDIDAGSAITNTVTAEATPPTGATAPPNQTADETVDLADPDPSLETVKTVSGPASPVAGDTVTFTITVQNTGNVTLSDITLDDTLRDADGTLITPSVPVYDSGDTDGDDRLDVTETWTYTLDRVLTQDDIDAGGLENTVTATGTPPSGPDVFDVSNNAPGAGSTPTTFDIAPNPGIEAEKVLTASPVVVDGVVRFAIRLTNTGNVTLTGVAITDEDLQRAGGTPLTLDAGPTFTNATLGSGEGTLLPGEVATYTGSYQLQQADIDAGAISNQVTVEGTDPNGTVVDDLSDNGVDGDGNTADDRTELTFPSNPALSMAKTLSAGGPTFAAVNDVLEFTFTVTNEGNITLTDPIVITDPLITDAGGTIVCDPVPLAPGDSLDCVGSYAVTQDDIDAGEVVNNAFASSGTTDSATDSVRVPADQNPAVSVDKEAVSITTGNPPPNDTSPTIDPIYYDVGAIITYEYTVTNDGNTTLDAPVTVNDNLIASVNCPTPPGGELAPTESVVCEATYEVTVDDLDLGSTTNLATATVDGTTSTQDSVTVPSGADPALSLTKTLTAVQDSDGSADDDGAFDTVGDRLIFTFEVTNSGDAAFVRDIVINDPLLDANVTCFTSTTADPSLSVGESITCEGVLTIDQDDLDNGIVENEAVAQTTYGASNLPVTSPPARATATGDEDPGLEIVKSADITEITGLPTTITYTLTLNNTGNQTLTNVSATDPLLPDLTCSFATLAAGTSRTCSDTYVVTQDDIDAGVVRNTASASAIDPNGNGISDTDTLDIDGPPPNPVLVLNKSVTPNPFGPAGSGLSYTLTVINDGNVTLTDVQVVDDILDPPFTCAIPRLEVGETNDTCQFSYTVTQDDFDAGEIVNDASASAQPPTGARVLADDSIRSSSVPAMPGIEATKVGSTGASELGDVVTYTLTLVNTGDVTLTVDSIVDTMTRRDTAGSSTALDAPFGNLSGDDDGDLRLDVTETWTLTAEHTITQADIDAGGFDNTVTVTASDPFGEVVTDVSDDGDDTDGNTEDDPTGFTIAQAPAINLVKTVGTTASFAGEVVTFTLVATNTGNTTLSDITIADTLTNAAGTALTPDSVEATDPSPAVPIAPGETQTFTVSYTLTQEDVDSGSLTNTATATGLDPFGNPVTDVSDNGDDTDGNLDDDPTVLTIDPQPQLDVVKTADERDDPDAPLFAGDVISFTVAVSNTGSVTLSDIVLTDTLTNGAGEPVVVDDVVFADGPAEEQIAPGDTNTYTVSYVLTQVDLDAGGVTNSASVTAQTPGGEPVTDTSDNGNDEDGNTEDDPTPYVFERLNLLEPVKMATAPEQVSASEYAVTFTMEVTNTGNVTQNEVQVFDDLVGWAQPATLVSTTVPVISGWSGTAAPNPAFDGNTDRAMLASGVSLAPGATGTLEIDVVFDVTAGFPTRENVITVGSEDILEPLVASVLVTTTNPPDFFATKSVAPEQVLRGDTVTYTLTFENRNAQVETGILAIDRLPAGVAYTPGSAERDGAAFEDPDLAGRQMQWSGLIVGPLATTTITFDARVSGDLGELTNEAWVATPDGTIVSNIATATIRIRPEAVFDCGDVIGKVFDDRNFNGYQDGVPEVDRSLVTDQTYYGDKAGKADPAPLPPEAEPGLPNVRLSTVTGTLITTDAYGRFSVPCAELPAAIGSNFTLKLDERTLPTGYSVTTENPRTIRLTPGTVAKLNFGAGLGNVIDIDLMAAAFGPNGAQPTQALSDGVSQVIRQLQDKPALLRLNYYLNGESRDMARNRLDAAEALIRARWRELGRAPLRVTREIRRVQ